MLFHIYGSRNWVSTAQIWEEFYLPRNILRVSIHKNCNFYANSYHLIESFGRFTVGGHFYSCCCFTAPSLISCIWGWRLIQFFQILLCIVVKLSQVLIGNDMSSPYIDIMYLGEDKSPGFRFYYALLVTLHQ